jgi:adenylylsulfate kinase
MPESAEQVREEALLITGVFGTGKSSVAQEVTHHLERHGFPHALIDVDYLGWFGVGDDAHYRNVLLQNLEDVVRNYRAVGVRRFVLAHSVEGAPELQSLVAVLGMPVTVVRLDVPIEAIERRLSADVTTGRLDDLEEARRWIEAGQGSGIEDFAVSNDRSIREVTSDILSRLGWVAPDL